MKKYDWAILTGRLYDLLADAWGQRSDDEDTPGLDIHEIGFHLDIPRKATYQVIRRLRIVLGGEQPINVVWRREGQRRIYFLTGMRSEAYVWNRYRLDWEASSLESHAAVAASIVASTDAETLEGRAARLMFKQLTRLLEDIRDVQAA